jgi:hypothetical protein
MARRINIINDTGRTLCLSVSVGSRLTVTFQLKGGMHGQTIGDGRGITVDLPDGSLPGWHPSATANYLTLKNCEGIRLEIGASERRDPSMAAVFLQLDPTRLN